MKTLVLALLLSQPWLSAEQSYGPYSRPQLGGRHAMAVGADGILMAWSENAPQPRIHVALLDTRAQLISPISILPAEDATAESYAPTVSSSGDAFLVAWVERYRGAERVRGAVVDRSGVPVTAPQTYGLAKIQFSFNGPEELVTPFIAWDGAGWHVWGGNRVFTILPNGERISDSNPWPDVHAAMYENAVFATATSKKTPIYRGCFLFRCEHYADRWDVVWTAGDGKGSEQVGDEWGKGSDSVSEPSLAATGDQFALAWSSTLGIGYTLTSSSIRARTVDAIVKVDAAPGLACDDERCVIAYETTGGDVQAIVFETDDLRSPELLTIAATERKERAPLVHHLGSGRFLVSYLSDQGDADRRINGRILTLRPPRRRAVR